MNRANHSSCPCSNHPTRKLITPLRWLAVLAITASTSIASNARAEDPAVQPDSFPSPRELRSLSLEELADIRITTVSRRPERLREAPAAVSVATREDIRRAGATSIPEALRLVTGVHVARANNNTWAVGVRGFNLTTTNKLLVLQDGRSLYSPLFSGVFWDVQDTVMEDIERIEVVRGPGTTLWGANAVNGVINIITRSARDTQGTLLAGGRGSRERGFAAARHGGQAGENAWYRVYARGWDRDDIVAADGSGTGEHRRFGQGGFRIDSTPAPDTDWTLQGDLYDGRFDRGDDGQIDVGGGNVLGRWTHNYDVDRHVSLQAYYDRVERDIPGSVAEVRNTADLRFEHRFFGSERHDLMWGGDARVSRDDVDNGPTIGFEPDSRTLRLFSGFLQDRVLLVPDRLELTLGSKLEHNTYSGFEYQPSARVAWMPKERQTVWASVSRAMRTPSRIDTDFEFDSNTGNPRFRGNRNFRSERLVAYESGYRWRPATPVALDFALFYNDYDHLRSFEESNPVVFGNGLEGKTYGGELSASYQISEWWRLKAGYAHLRKKLRAKEGSDDDPEGRGAEGNDPRHIATLHSALDLGECWTLDGVLRHVSSLPNPSVPSYTELDMRIAYYLREGLELSLAGRNLLNAYHREFGAADDNSTRAVPRSVLFRVKWEL